MEIKILRQSLQILVLMSKELLNLLDYGSMLNNATDVGEILAITAITLWNLLKRLLKEDMM